VALVGRKRITSEGLSGMENDKGNGITGGAGGNTGGTGGPGFSGNAEGGGAGATGQDGGGSGGQADYGSAGPQVVQGEGQGDDLANRLGGGEGGRSAGTPAAAESGDMSAGRTETDASAAPGGGIGDDPGAPGGMGGVRGGMPNPDHRPNGGVSPMGSSSADD
jgi:hypothetical protein